MDWYIVHLYQRMQNSPLFCQIIKGRTKIEIVAIWNSQQTRFHPLTW